MTPKIFFGVVCGLAMLGAAVKAEPDGHRWDDYGNARFNYAICYPSDLLKGQGEADNGDGQTFTSADGASLWVYGFNNINHDPLDADLGQVVTGRAGQGAKITYRVRRPNWLVASGVGPAGEFYLKRFKRGDQVLAFEFTYPVARRAIYAPIAGRLSHCFTIGTESGF